MLFFVIAVGILAMIYGYVGWRIIIPLGVESPWDTILWILLILFFCLPIISFFLRVRKIKARWRDQILTVAFLSMGFFILAFTGLIMRDLTLAFTSGAGKAIALIQQKVDRVEIRSGEPFHYDFNRIVYGSNLGILVLAGIFMGYGVYEARRQPRVVRVTVPIEKLPDNLKGFRLVQISDLHVGPSIKRDFVQSVINRVNTLAPDAIVFTGDLADGSVQSLRNDVAPIAGLSAPHGVYFVTGNHEYYSGADAWVEEVKRLGLKVLMNEHCLIQRGNSKILLAGVTDYSARAILANHSSSPELAITDAPQNDVKILLAHQPRSVFKAADLGFDLQISGHTHGGQFFPGNLMVRLQQPYVAGLYRHKKTWLYVSRGTGYWGPPIRLGARSEITVIELTEDGHETSLSNPADARGVSLPGTPIFPGREKSL